MKEHKTDLLGIFAHHKVAANLLMVIMLLAGILGLDRMNVQFFPNFEIDIVTVSVTWSGASAEDIEDGITNPLEQRLRTVDKLRKLSSTSTQGVSSISLEFEEGTDPLLALDQTRRMVDEFRNLPGEAEPPQVASVSRYEPVARLLVSGLDELDELRSLVRRFENELLDRGIDKVNIKGLPEEEISIQVDPLALERLGLSLDQVADRVKALSRDQPAGILGRAEGPREIRSLDQRRDAAGFSRLPVVAGEQVRIELGSVATIERQPRDGAVHLSIGGRPAAELALKRSEGGDSLQAAEILDRWLADIRPRLPPNIEIQVYDESWHLIRDRIMLLLKNGGGGLLLVVLILYLFLTGRVAFWVAVGIPVSFMATLFILWLAGGSVNMISLFALIMALGIIVDDAIVVGEDALAHYQMGERPLLAAEGGARRMLAPVMASSLTTISAFLPLMLIGGIIGNILSAIPLVIVSVIIASLVESFLVLPGHLRHSFLHVHEARPRSLRARLDNGFARFREQVFRPLVRAALAYRAITLSGAIACLIMTVGLVAGGRLVFNFFPTPEAQMLHANAAFVSGTPRKVMEQFVQHLEETLYQTEKELRQGELVNVAVVHQGARVAAEDAGGSFARGDQLGALQVELVPPDERSVRNEDFTRAWRERIQIPAGMESFTITARRAGPPGRDLTVRLTGNDAEVLKEASLELTGALDSLNGVTEVSDDLAYGSEQLIYSLTPAGEAEGLTVSGLGGQLRSAFDGRLVQIFQDGPEEVEVRVRLSDEKRDSPGILDRLNIQLPDGNSLSLSSVSDWRSRRGFEVLRHAEGHLSVEVSADVDSTQANVDRIIAMLDKDMLPGLAGRYGIDYSFEGRSADQRETLSDMRKGAMLGLVLIYLVLAWVFASYGWPLVVMTAIPFGVTGALFGHWVMGLDVTILSLFGLFGLSGIVVNDSIILVTFYKRLRREGMSTHQALEEAACQRLRAVLLTSLTTIAGLTPLLFETSLQAQFLIPMATSIAFGLAFATVLILLFLPALLSIYEDILERFKPTPRGVTVTSG
ncbi:MAG: efflux RND transporter permease subunit [Gammaproteobacteria bacterium]|nr:efflux RND transporter permease subunit [Gammaproteobacteria bacterium]